MSEELPSLSEGRWRIAELLNRKRFDAARALLGPALREHPLDAGLLYEAARADYLQQRMASARELLGQLLHRAPSDRDARHLLFWVACGELEWVEAESLVLALLRDYPQAPDYWADYAHLMWRSLFFDKASQLVREALRLDAQHAFALRVQALCDLAAGKTGGPALRQLLIDHPDDALTLQLVIASLVRQGRSREAQRLARELLRSQPGDADQLEQLRELAFINHWSLVPLRPLARFGWGGSALLWLSVVLLGRFIESRWPLLATPFWVIWISFAVYTWVWPPLLKRWLARDD